MAGPFQRRDEARTGLLGSLLARRRVDCLREIEHLLASAERLADVPPAAVAEIARRHDIDLEGRLRTARRCLYRRFLEHCLADQTLTDEERRDLEHLRQLLRLDARDAEAVHEQAVREVYGAALDEVLEDFRLDPEEEAFLERLRSDLAISGEIADALREEREARARQRFLSRGAVHEHALVAGRRAVFEVDGRSERGLEDAIRAAIDGAQRTVPQVAVARLHEVRTELRDGRIAGWSVTLRMALDEEGEGEGKGTDR